MNAPNPVSVDAEPGSTPDETVVTARFSRKKVVQTLAAAAAVGGAVLVIFGAGKKKGKNDFIDDVQAMSPVDDTDESDAS